MLNQITVQGRLTADPEQTSLPNGRCVVNFVLACEREKRNPQDEKRVDFIPCIAWNRIGELIADKYSKGDMLFLDGRLQSREFTGRDGIARTAYEVLVTRLNTAGGQA